MIRFDKLKIISPIEHVSNINEERFKVTLNNGELECLSYTQDEQFALYIEIDYHEQELVLEFTGKILGIDYPKLISIDTIRTCLSNINNLGLCTLDIKAIIRDGYVVKCDVTKDVYDIDDFKVLRERIIAHINNYKKYVINCKGTSNLVIEKDVKSKAYKCRLTIYDKEKEMHKAKNGRWMMGNPLLSAFKGCIRFELNLNSMQQIRKRLQVTDTQLTTVLSTPVNPIMDFLCEVLKDEASIPPTDGRRVMKYLRTLLLQRENYDLNAVEKIIRALTPNVRKAMEPFRQLAEEHNTHPQEPLLQYLRRLLA